MLGSKPRVLVVTRNLPPAHGGIERLLARAAEALAAEFELHVIGPAGCGNFLPPGTRVLELPPAVPLFLGAALAAVGLGRPGRGYDLCIAGSGLVAPVAAFAAKRSGGRWLGFIHGLDVTAPHRLYQDWFVPVLRGAALLIANSRHTAALAHAAGVPAPRVRVIAPGVDVPTAPGPARSGPPVLLSVGRLVPRKGFAEFIERALPRILERQPGARYVLVGAEPERAAAGATDAGARIRAAIAARGLAERVTLAGAVSDAALDAAYAAARVLVFPSLSEGGDVEGFGMVALEAAAHGVPTVAFDSGGVADAVSPGSGLLAPAGDYDAFADAVLRVLEGKAAITPESCRAHAARFAWARFDAAIVAAAREVLAR